MRRLNHINPDLGSKRSASAKREAHYTNFKVWCELTQRVSLNPQEEYWTLILNKSRSVEVQDLHESGVIPNFSGVHGVNMDPSIISLCVQEYPGIHLHTGEWVEVINRRPPCPHGGIVYFDSQNQPDGKEEIASSSLVRTLEVCGPHTLVCANFCVSRPRQGNVEVSHEKYLSNVSAKLTPYQKKRWVMVETDTLNLGVYQNSYSPPMPNRTQMKTFFYWSES